jgi:hypothetical protein
MQRLLTIGASGRTYASRRQAVVRPRDSWRSVRRLCEVLLPLALRPLNGAAGAALMTSMSKAAMLEVDVLPKPCPPAVLAAAIDKAVERMPCRPRRPLRAADT